MNEIAVSIFLTIILIFIIFIICKLGFIQSRLFSLINRVDAYALSNFNNIKNAVAESKTYTDLKLADVQKSY